MNWKKNWQNPSNEQRLRKLTFHLCKWDCNFDLGLQFRFQQNCQIAIANRFRFGIEETTSFFISCCVGRIENRNCNSNCANGIAISILAKLSNCNCKAISIWNRRKYIIFQKFLCWSNRESKLQFQLCKWDYNFDLSKIV